ncbi:MAG: phytanoyl-CoA dioxygenase family protein [Bryobacteraceae bacterium]
MDHRAAALEFHENGYLVIPQALSAGQLSALNRAVDQDLEHHEAEWVRFDESLIETTDVLPRTDEFDFTIENPITLPILRSLIGELISFEEFEIMIRNPTEKVRDIKSWHRDATRDYGRRMDIEYISLIYYLTDVSEHDHCFSIVPGTHSRLVDLKPAEVAPNSEVDITGPAGTAVIFHGRCIHSGKLKTKSNQRRTLHMYFARADQPRYSEWTSIPPRLYQKKDESLPPLLYSKWNLDKVFEGVGKKPRDLPQTMSIAEMLKEVQRRANPAA